MPKPTVVYRVVEGSDPDVVLTQIRIKRLDVEQLKGTEITDLLNDIKSVLPDNEYRIGHETDIFDEVLTVYVNRTRAEREKLHGNPFGIMIIPKSEIEDCVRNVPQKDRKWLPM